MRSTRTVPATPRRRVTISPEEIRRFLASDAGRVLRRATAAGLIIGLPMLLRIPLVRRHPLLRWLELLGGVALIVKLAEALRDWEPGSPIQLDVE